MSPCQLTLRVDTNRQIGEGSREAEELLVIRLWRQWGNLSRSSFRNILGNATGQVLRDMQTGFSALPEITTTIAVHKTGRHTKLPISVNAICGKDEEIAAVEATFYSSRDLAWQVRGLRGLGGKPNVPFLLELCASSLDPQMSPLSGFRRKRNKVV